jgi:cyclophilin family peptidyl-prolyl cis-trans isomerase
LRQEAELRQIREERKKKSLEEEARKKKEEEKKQERRREEEVKMRSEEETKQRNLEGEKRREKETRKKEEEKGKQLTKNCVFLDITRGSTPLGRMTVRLHTEAAPETCETFRLLCTGERGHCYKGDTFSDASSSCVRGGRDTGGDGRACPGERGMMWEYGPGVLAMDTDGSWFYIYIGEPVLWDRIVLGGRVVRFGKVIEGMDVVRKIRGDDIIQNCGQL